MAVDDNEVNDLVDDFNNKDTIHLNEVKGFVIDRVQHEEDNQQHYFDVPIENEGEQHNHFGGPDQENIIADHDINFDGDADEDNNHNDINLIQGDTDESFHTTEANHDNTEDLSDEDGNDEADVTSKSNYLSRELDSDLDIFLDTSHSHLISSMVIAEEVGARMMKEYFKIEASKATPQYGFRKGLKLFSNKDYQAAKNELMVNLLGRGCIDMLSWNDLPWDIRKQALGYLVFLKRKRSGKIKGRGCADGQHQREYITKEESSSPTV